MKLIVYGLIGLGLLIIVHHWYVHRRLVDPENILNHEFFAGLCFALALGGLLLA